MHIKTETNCCSRKADWQTPLPIGSKAGFLNPERRLGLSPSLLMCEKLNRYLPIRNILVPQAGQVPWVAGLPFFMVMLLAFLISFLVRHLTQYPCIGRLLFLITKDKPFPAWCQEGMRLTLGNNAWVSDSGSFTLKLFYIKIPIMNRNGAIRKYLHKGGNCSIGFCNI